MTNPNKGNKFHHFAKNLDFKEVCENQGSLETHDNVPIRKILIANLHPDTSHKILVNTFQKFGKIVHCILLKKRHYEEKEVQINIDQPQEKNSDPTANMKSYAFITYSNAEEAQSAIQAGISRDISIKKHYLRVIPANSWNQPDNLDSRKVCYVCKLKNSKVDLNKTLSSRIYYQVDDGSLFCKLNNDCLRCIFNFLPYYDRVRVERVSRRWKLVSEEAWHDQHHFSCNPNSWGLKSTRDRFLMNPDACRVIKILKRCCPFLIHIDLSSSSNQLGNSTLIELADMCPLIESINLRNFQFAHSGIRALVTSCKSLKSISLGYTEIDRYKFDDVLTPLFALNQKLQKLDIDCFIIEGYCLRHIPKLSIQELTLRNANYVIRNGLYEIFRKFKNLRVIKVIGIPAAFGQYSEFIMSICSCEKLEVVELPTRRRGDRTVNNQNFHFVQPLTNLSNLTKINLKGNCTVGDDFLMILAITCQRLTSVDISDCPYIRDPGLDYITSLPNLQYLCIDDLSNVTDVVFLKTMPNIKTLLCSNCVNFRSLGLSMLIESANRLEILDLSNCKLIANDLVIDTIRRCKRTRWRCLKMYLKGTNARLDGINLGFHWNYLRLMNKLRPENEDEILHFIE